MISLKTVQIIHNEVIKRHGGGTGIRDIGALEAALARPFATFGEIDLYPTAIEKGAAILESVLINHPFVDGNKRTGYVLMELLILTSYTHIYATEDERYAMVIAVSTGEYRFDQIAKWLKTRVA